MPDVIEQLRRELRTAVAERPADQPAAFDRIVRRAVRRRVATRVGAVAGLAVVLTVVVMGPQFLSPPTGDRSVAAPPEGKRSTPTGMAPCVPPQEPSSGTCGQPAFDVAPAAAVAGTTVEVSGSCQAVLDGRATSVSVLLSRKTSRRYAGGVGADGNFRVPVELPWRLLPARYQVTVTCVAERGEAGFTGVALLGGRPIDVARPAAATSAPGQPRPGSLSATLSRQPQGLVVQIRGGGCYLSSLNGVRGLVRIALASTGVNGSGGPGPSPASRYGSLTVEPGPDGAWSTSLPTRGGGQAGGQASYDIYAYCTDDLGGLGFMYRTVYRFDGGRLLPVQPLGA